MSILKKKQKSGYKPSKKKRMRGRVIEIIALENYREYINNKRKAKPFYV